MSQPDLLLQLALFIPNYLPVPPNGDTITNSNHPVFQWDGKIGAGFNSSRFFGGIFFSAAAVYHNDRKVATLNINARGSYQAFIGYHFLAPKAIRSSYDKVYEKIYKKKS